MKARVVAAGALLAIALAGCNGNARVPQVQFSTGVHSEHAEGYSPTGTATPDNCSGKDPSIHHAVCGDKDDSLTTPSAKPKATPVPVPKADPKPTKLTITKKAA